MVRFFLLNAIIIFRFLANLAGRITRKKSHRLLVAVPHSVYVSITFDIRKYLIFLQPKILVYPVNKK